MTDHGSVASLPHHAEPGSATEPGVGVSEPVWLCFHCGEAFTDRQCAAEHFGTDWYCEVDPAACVQILTEGEKAIVNERREGTRLLRKAEDDLEAAEQALSSLRWDVREIVRREAKRQGVQLTDSGDARELKWVWETMEGQMLAANAALDAAPRWLARYLRRRAERRWKATHATPLQVAITHPRDGEGASRPNPESAAP